MMQFLSDGVLMAMSRRKTLAEAQSSEDNSGGGGLHRSLTALDLILYGVGSSVGAGIYVLVGLGAKIAGPAISLSFLGCGAACILTSLAYAEFASRIPVAGSAFTYVYVAFGEFIAWLVGWNLILGYGFTASVVARAWADYTGDFVQKMIGHPVMWIEQFTELEIFGPNVNYTCSPSALSIVGVCTLVLLRGAKDSSRFSNIMTVLNIGVLGLVILAGLSSNSVSTDNLTPFSPHHTPGVLQGAGLVFFAFIGFDMVASLTEEVIHPEKNMPVGIVGSLIISTLIYVAVSVVVVGMAPIEYLGEKVPVANALMTNACCSHEDQLLEQCLANNCDVYVKPILACVGHIVACGAIFGLTASCFTSLMGQPRIFYKMAQDGLWYDIFAIVDPRTQVPRWGIIITGVVTAALACFVPLAALANLISLGTLMVFTFVDAGVILLRLQRIQQSSSTTTTTTSTTTTAKQEGLHEATQYKTVIYLLVIYTASLLVASILTTTSPGGEPFVMMGCIVIAVLSGCFISIVPESWSITNKQQTNTNDNDIGSATGEDYFVGATNDHEHSQFNCPWVPAVPLLGMACNTFMMGSLPLSAWVFCLLWMVGGVFVYFSYGIHHSKLNGRNNEYQDTTTSPLLLSPGGSLSLVEDGYSSTLNVSIRVISKK